MDNDAQRAEFVRRLLDWYPQEKRDLPWRNTRDPYAIWVSEVMLQQTRVATVAGTAARNSQAAGSQQGVYRGGAVIPYWTRWMARFPTVRALAEAPLGDVLKQWQGLGYYARARNLHRAAQAVLDKHGGAFPTRFEDVLALPGVGRYTAGAVCSIAFGQDVPLVDANVIRVLCRVFGMRGDPKSAKTQAALWELARTLVPAGKAAAFNQAMMELGALVCQAAPRCPLCPVREICAAYASGNPTSLPEFAPRPAFTSQTDVSAVVRHPGDGRLLLAQRPAQGLWGGLWEFPRVTLDPDESVEEGAERAARQVTGLAVRAGERVGVVKHGVTTRRITLIGVACTPHGEAGPADAGCAAWAWARQEDLDAYALSSPQTRLLAQLRARREQPTLFEVAA